MCEQRPNATTRAAMEEARDMQDDPLDVEMRRRTMDALRADNDQLRKLMLIIAEQAETPLLPEEMPEAMDDIAAMARAALNGEEDA
jgi:uncharacterized protein YjgD (DUF1641 family)